MAEFSGYWTTGGTDGDQQTSYTQAQMATAAKIMSACSGFEGVAPGYLNALAGTVTGANTVAINTGGAMVDGKFFVNDASQNVNIPSAAGAGNTRIDRIVLRADWANYNVSVTRIAGTDAASPSAPNITQTSGTTYDIKLYQALVDTSGTVTITDERTMASPFKARQGGSATDWITPGTNNYTPKGSLVQHGAGTITVTAGQTVGSLVVTFPIEYSGKPNIFLSWIGEYDATIIAIYTTEDYTDTDEFYASCVRSGTSGTINQTFSWLAIGPA